MGWSQPLRSPFASKRSWISSMTILSGYKLFCATWKKVTLLVHPPQNSRLQTQSGGDNMLNSQVYQLFVGFIPHFLCEQKGILEIRVINGTQHPLQKKWRLLKQQGKIIRREMQTLNSPRGELCLRRIKLIQIKSREQKGENVQIRKAT